MGNILTDIAGHPFTLGLAVGVINGYMAQRRKQSIEQDTALAILLPTLAAEAYLAYKNPPDDRSVTDLAASTGAGLFVGLAPFIRWDPNKRALLENPEVPAPATLADLQELAGCRYC